MQVTSLVIEGRTLDETSTNSCLKRRAEQRMLIFSHQKKYKRQIENSTPFIAEPSCLLSYTKLVVNSITKIGFMKNQMPKIVVPYNPRKTNSWMAGISPIFFSESLLGCSSTPIAITACFLGAILPTLMKLTFTFSSPKTLPTFPIIPG